MEKADTTVERVGGYRVVRRLAIGGTSDVLLAKAEGPLGFERTVVLKRLLAQYKNDDEFAKMFAREASAYARLAHPSIVRLFDFFAASAVTSTPAPSASAPEAQLVMVLEYVDGPALHRLRGMLKAVGQPLEDDAAIHVAANIFDALAAAHAAMDDSGAPAPVIHRDVNPSNVLVGWDGQVKIADFGIAKVTGVSHESRAGLIKGTYGYMAPEQVTGAPTTPRADVYAGAIVLWEMLTRRRAFQRGALPEIEVLRSMAEPRLPSLDSLRPDVDKNVREAVLRALEPSAQKRTITAEEMVSILRSVVAPDRGRERLCAALALVRHEPKPAAATIPPPASSSANVKPADDLTGKMAPVQGAPPPRPMPRRTPPTLRAVGGAVPRTTAFYGQHINLPPGGPADASSSAPDEARVASPVVVVGGASPSPSAVTAGGPPSPKAPVTRPSVPRVAIGAKASAPKLTAAVSATASLSAIDAPPSSSATGRAGLATPAASATTDPALASAATREAVDAILRSPQNVDASNTVREGGPQTLRLGTPLPVGGSNGAGDALNDAVDDILRDQPSAIPPQMFGDARERALGELPQAPPPLRASTDGPSGEALRERGDIESSANARASASQLPTAKAFPVALKDASSTANMAAVGPAPSGPSFPKSTAVLGGAAAFSAPTAPMPFPFDASAQPPSAGASRETPSTPPSSAPEPQTSLSRPAPPVRTRRGPVIVVLVGMVLCAASFGAAGAMRYVQAKQRAVATVSGDVREIKTAVTAAPTASVATNPFVSGDTAPSAGSGPATTGADATTDTQAAAASAVTSSDAGVANIDAGTAVSVIAAGVDSGVDANAMKASPADAGANAVVTADAGASSNAGAVSATASTPDGTVPAGMGIVKTDGTVAGRRIFVDERTVGQTPSAVTVKCGTHAIKIGSTGHARSIDVPCGGEVLVGDH